MSIETTPIAPLPDELDSPRSKLVYLSLSTTGGATLDELQNGLDLPKITLYTVIRSLRERGLVNQDGESLTLAA
ncbi:MULTISPECIES: helix-turn-helix domain-containing protein [unclassified Haladaptatus]|uniref:helix-turn-helix domain-containing protein n=1 Tax=unclassified Haladaptatus TaxID=2622732 RepID=UPI00209C5231|nr:MULTISPECIES: helix-turn-helix domain-containing protein [unclassified Haladaptatus]MCO8245261.1 helix-turn-helix domain-containing protein [Haladaptatus sp. AB643]MCO8253406.1 helix-turn-helix domain-containing protein [Haladaptatus sp. AB618]